MGAEAAKIDEYITAAPEERRDALNLLRGLCREVLSGYEEAMRHGMPSYLRDGAIEVAFATQKTSINLYVLRQAALRAKAQRLAGLSVGKGAIRFRRPDQIDAVTVRALLIA